MELVALLVLLWADLVVAEMGCCSLLVDRDVLRGEDEEDDDRDREEVDEDEPD
jgi:hypothetical protein